jgi:hypothetical protein
MDDRMLKKKFLLILFIPILLAACGYRQITADTFPWISDEEILFRDDFSHQSGGWNTFEDNLSYSGYFQGGFRLKTDVANYQIWSVPGLNFKDAQIFVQAEKIGGNDNNLFGLLCRFQDDSNYYAFVISSDGYFGIYEKLYGELELIDQRHMDFSPEIKRGAAINDIQAVCQGKNLVLSVNDVLLLQVQDDSITYGDVGLIVGNLSDGGVDILFDHFIVVKR